MFVPFKNTKISFRLAVGYSVLFIFAVLVAGGVIFRIMHSVLEDHIERDLRTTTNTVVSMVQTAADVSIKNRLQAVAEKNLEILQFFYRQYKTGEIDEATAKSRAKEILLSQTIGETGYIYCIDSDGIIRVHPVDSWVGSNASAHEFVNLQRKKHRGYLEYDWQNPGEDYARPKALYMTYFEPWDWILSVSAYRSEFASLVDVDDFRDKVASIRVEDSGYTFILSPNGDVILHPFLKGSFLYADNGRGKDLLQTMLRKKSGVLQYTWKNPTDIDAREKILVFRTLPNLNWIVGSASYLNDVYSPLTFLGWTIFGTVIVSLILLLPLSFFTARSITRPIGILMEALDKAADGDMTVRCSETSRDEVGVLSARFNQFMDRLQESREALENEVDERKRAEYQRKLFEEVFENALEGILITDSLGHIIAVNPSFTEITGFTPEEVLGHNPRVLKSDRHDDDFYRDMWGTLQDEDRWSGEIWNRRKSGESYPELLSISAVRNKEGSVEHYVSVFHDITDMKRKEEQIHFQAHYDALTGLPNRVLLHDRLQVSIAHARKQGTRVAVIHVDLDNFKNVNDSLGHALGDTMLQEVADRLTDSVSPDDTVARLSGDEFVIMVEGTFLDRYMVELSNLLLGHFTQPFTLGDHEVYVTASIGVSVFPEDADDPETLLKNADMAMFRAKEVGKNTYHLFTPEMHNKVNTKLQLDSDMRRGLKRDEFMVYYQPKVDLEFKRIIGMEALVRWIRLDGTLVNPGEFIPLAEENGIILEIGERVLDKACAFLRLLDEGVSPGLTVAVNLSPEQFRQTDLVDMVRRTLEIHELSPERLELEVTESTIMRDMDGAVATLNELVDMGIRISIDDFGTGYSSLYYLKKMPIETLKIDQSFVRDICEDPNDAKIVQAITAMADNLGIGVVAEGVETKEQETMLTGFGCRTVQGFLYSRPLPGPELMDFLARFGDDISDD